MDLEQLVKFVFAEALPLVGDETTKAVPLLLGTVAAESQGGNYLHQKGGPACGIFQIEPLTLNDIADNFVAYRQDRFAQLLATYPLYEWTFNRLIYDLKFATLVARLHYMRVPQALPVTPEEAAAYWKTHYNTIKGKGTVAHFLQAYEHFVVPVLRRLNYASDYY